MESFDIYYDHLVDFVVTWYTLSNVGILYQEKSGNPTTRARANSTIGAFAYILLRQYRTLLRMYICSLFAAKLYEVVTHHRRMGP
jgi:hypothetical protein